MQRRRSDWPGGQRSIFAEPGESADLNELFNMRLLVFGATEGTGRALLSQGQEQGHQMTAFVRNPAALEARPGLTIVETHGGRVTAQSAGKGQGCAFVVTLPLDSQPALEGVTRPPYRR